MTYKPPRLDTCNTHQDLGHLLDLREQGPCNPPSGADWTNPLWLDLWLRSHPDTLDQAITQHVRLLERANDRLTKGKN